MKLVASNGTEYPLAQPETTLGRAPASTIRLDDHKVSTNHAVIRLEGTAVIFQDLNSTNGSFINEARVTGSRPLQPGDQLRVGDTVLAVRADMDMDSTWVERTQPAVMQQPVISVSMPAPAAAPASSDMGAFQGLAIAGMIIGILSIPAGLLWFCGGPMGLVGLILSLVGLRAPKGRWMAIVGLLAALLGLLVAIVFLVLTIIRSRSSSLPAGF